MTKTVASMSGEDNGDGGEGDPWPLQALAWEALGNVGGSDERH